MARSPLKFLEGPVIQDPHVAVSAILDDCYLIERGKRLHPKWMASRPLAQIVLAVKHGHLRHAIPNPDHPENIGKKEST